MNVSLSPFQQVGKRSPRPQLKELVMDRQAVKKGGIWEQGGCKEMTNMERQEICLVLYTHDLVYFSQ